MIDVNLIGTSGTMPMPNRPLTALFVSCKGKSLLIDCGEGTQTVLREKHLSMSTIDIILFTHFHADHIAGLPGFLLTMGKQARTEPVTLAGPPELRKYVESLCVIAPELPFEIKLVEFSEEERTLTLGELKITAFDAEHNIPCLGYSIELPRAGKFNAEKAEQLGIEKRFWGSLQRGESVEANGNIISPNEVMGAPRKGLKVTYCTDSRPTDNITEHAKNSDLFICEGMYGSEDKLDKAIENKHLLFREAAEIAKAANVRELWLTHYSPSLNDPEEFLPEAAKIFPNTKAPANSLSAVLRFED